VAGRYQQLHLYASHGFVLGSFAKDLRFLLDVRRFLSLDLKPNAQLFIEFFHLYRMVQGFPGTTFQ